MRAGTPGIPNVGLYPNRTCGDACCTADSSRKNSFWRAAWVLILDEPTAGLDPNQIREVRETIRKLGRDKTILLSTHILQEVEAMADRLLFISEGELVYDGTVAQLNEQGKSLDERFAELTASVA